MLNSTLEDLQVMAAATPWMESGLCTQSDLAIFFPEHTGPANAAKRVCAVCPVRRECLEYALAEDMTYGVWGGLSAGERRRLAEAGLAA